MADKEKSQEKSKSSLFRSKSDGKRESKSKKRRNKRLQVLSNGANGDNVCETVKRAENVEGNVSKPSTSIAENDPNQGANDELLKREEQSSSVTTELQVPDNVEANLEVVPSTEQKAEGNVSEKEQGVNDKPSEHVKTSDIIEGMEHCDKAEIAAVEQPAISCERVEVQDASEVRQTLADVENKAREVTATGDSKKQRKSSSPLASFRRHRKKTKERKHLQDAENVEKSGDSLNESKKTTRPETSELSAITTEPEAAISKEGEEKQEIPKELTIKAVDLKENKVEKAAEQVIASGSEMANENTEEQGPTKKAHKEKRSGPFASFRKNKKKADSAKQEENKPEIAKVPAECGKENVADNVLEREEESIPADNKETTEQQEKQQQASQSDEQAIKPDNKLDSFSAQEGEAVAEKATVDDGKLEEEEDTESRPKKGKRFGSFSNFSRAKKQPKLTQQLTQRNNDREHMADTSTQVQTDVKSKLADSLPGQEKQEERDSLEKRETEEVAAAENIKELASGSETAEREQVPELSTTSGSERNSPEGQEQQQQDGNDTTPKKNKSGLKKRISKIRLHGSKNKENAKKEGAKSQPEVVLKGNNSEAGTSGSEISKQVKRKKSGGLHKKLSQALKRNKPGHLELNESHDDPSASEEECQPLLDAKSPDFTTGSEEKAAISEVDGEEQSDLKRDGAEQNPEITEEKEKEPDTEQSSNATSGSGEIVVKRVTFSLDEETIEMADSGIPEAQPLNSATEDGEQATEKHTDPETDEETQRDENDVKRDEEDGKKRDEEDGVEGIYIMCRSVMKLLMAELLEYVATRDITQQATTDHRVPTEESTTDEDLPKSAIVPDVKPSNVTISETRENDNSNVPESAASSMESLFSTGTVVIWESSDSELETVSPIPDLCVCENVDTVNESEEQIIQEEQAPELEEQTEETANTSAQVEESQDDDESTLYGSEELDGIDNMPQADDTSPVSEDADPEAGPIETPEISTSESQIADDVSQQQPEEEPTISEDNATTIDVPKEKGVVDRTVETSIEQSIERSIEESLQESLQRSFQSSQYFLSQSLKEEWILVRPRLDISQEMSSQFKALALDSYAHGPACCNVM